MNIEEAKNRLRLLLQDECDCPHCQKNKEAYEVVLEELEDLREDVWTYHQLLKMADKREYRSKFLKDFQAEHGKNIMPDYDEIYERYDKMKKQLENSISKKKIKDKIQKCEDNTINGINSSYYLHCKEVLQELLEDE